MQTLGPEEAKNHQVWANLGVRIKEQKVLIDARNNKNTNIKELIELAAHWNQN